MFSAFDKWKAAQREVALRRNVYRRRVQNGTMNASDAEREILLMEDIAEDYRAQCQSSEATSAPTATTA